MNFDIFTQWNTIQQKRERKREIEREKLRAIGNNTDALMNLKECDTEQKIISWKNWQTESFYANKNTNLTICCIGMKIQVIKLRKESRNKQWIQDEGYL